MCQELLQMVNQIRPRERKTPQRTEPAAGWLICQMQEERRQHEGGEINRKGPRICKTHM